MSFGSETHLQEILIKRLGLLALEPPTRRKESLGRSDADSEKKGGRGEKTAAGAV